MLEKKLSVCNRLHDEFINIAPLHLTLSFVKTVLILVLVLTAFMASAQSVPSAIPAPGSQKNYTLLLKDGSVVSGRIVRRDSSNIVVRQRNGRLTYVDLELFDRVIDTPTANPLLPVAAVADAPVEDTNEVGNYLILFKDGSQVRGRIVRRDSTTLVIRKRNGEMTYADPALLETVVDPRRTTVENAFAPFMTLNQTAYTVDPGHLYYRNVWGIYNEFNYGISRNWSIGASVLPLAWFLSDAWFVQSVSFQTKVSVPIGPLFRLGVSAAYQPSRTYEFYKLDDAWNLQAVASVGDAQRSVTIGYGRSSGGNNKRNRQPYFTLSALLKLTPGLSFITDNTLYTNQYQYFSGTASLFSAALRIDRPRHAFDLGVLGQTYAGGSRNPQFIPYLAYNLRIGR